VFEDPYNPDNAVVRVYNEVDGKAPDGWRSRSGKHARAAYLKEEYARIPRIKCRVQRELVGKIVLLTIAMATSKCNGSQQTMERSLCHCGRAIKSTESVLIVTTLMRLFHFTTAPSATHII
jgi:hypothetical protein